MPPLIRFFFSAFPSFSFVLFFFLPFLCLGAFYNLYVFSLFFFLLLLYTHPPNQPYSFFFSRSTKKKKKKQSLDVALW